MPDILIRGVPEVVHAAVKDAAANAGQTMGDWLIEVMRERLDLREWVHAYSIAINHIEFAQCDNCGEEVNVTDMRPVTIMLYRLYDQNDRFRLVVCENCLREF